MGRLRAAAVRGLDQRRRPCVHTWRSDAEGVPRASHDQRGERRSRVRNANRIHVTTREGKFLKEFKLAEQTGVGGATGGVGFSQDKQQKFLYISDLTNNHIYFLDRESGKEVGRMGSMGESGGSFWGLHMIAVDSKGNIYTGEVFAGQRIQRFVPADSPRGKVLDQLSRAGL